MAEARGGPLGAARRLGADRRIVHCRVVATPRSRHIAGQRFCGRAVLLEMSGWDPARSCPEGRPQLSVPGPGKSASSGEPPRPENCPFPGREEAFREDKANRAGPGPKETRIPSIYAP